MCRRQENMVFVRMDPGTSRLAVAGRNSFGITIFQIEKEYLVKWISLGSLTLKNDLLSIGAVITFSSASGRRRLTGGRFLMNWDFACFRLGRLLSGYCLPQGHDGDHHQSKLKLPYQVIHFDFPIEEKSRNIERTSFRNASTIFLFFLIIAEIPVVKTNLPQWTSDFNDKSDRRLSVWMMDFMNEFSDTRWNFWSLTDREFRSGVKTMDFAG